MPIRQYFLWVGSVLLAVLFVADLLLPAPVAHSRAEIPPNERVNLQIRSNHKWPERVVFDTAHSAPSFAQAHAEPGLVPPPDPARGLPNALAEVAPARASAATNDNASAIPAKPVPGAFRMTGTIKVD